MRGTDSTHIHVFKVRLHSFGLIGLLISVPWFAVWKILPLKRPMSSGSFQMLVSGFCQFRPGKRAKSVSLEQRVARLWIA